MSAAALLEVRDLRVHAGALPLVDGIDFAVAAGETLGMVGESGCGKSTTGLAVLGLLPRPLRASGEIRFDGRDLAALSERERRATRGRDISMVLQDPMASLNPVLDIGVQVGEAFDARSPRAAPLRARVVAALRGVRIPAPELRARDYPHQMSGGMKQRVAGAIAIARHPRLLIADEPTTSLDVTIQAQYLALLKDLQAGAGMAMIFITHDFGVVARMCTRVCVMYAGRIVETAPVREIFSRPRHWYTAALIASRPKLGARVERLAAIPGAPPRPAAPVPGCRFAPRCPGAQARCRAESPPTTGHGEGHSAACWYPRGPA